MSEIIVNPILNFLNLMMYITIQTFDTGDSHYSGNARYLKAMHPGSSIIQVPHAKHIISFY